MNKLFKFFFNFQVIISYFGLIPFILVLLDAYIFNIFLIKSLKDFIFFYTLIIFTFIGAMRWSLKDKSNKNEVFFGFLPSLISTILIILQLFIYNINIMLILVVIFLFLQLFVDFLFYKYNFIEKYFYYIVRLPITLIITINIIYLILV